MLVVPVSASRTETNRKAFPSAGFSVLYPCWVPSVSPVDLCSRALLKDGEVQVYSGRVSALYTVAEPFFPPVPNGA
jgi:hypothetical protein